MGPVQHNLAGLAALHGRKTLFKLGIVETMGQHRGKIQAALHHVGHLVPVIQLSLIHIYTAAMLRKEGQSLQEVAAWVRENAQTFCAWFTVNDLMFLKRGGRLSGTAAVAGTLLGIKPVLHVDPAGHLVAMEKVRGRKASLDALVKHYRDGAFAHENQTV